MKNYFNEYLNTKKALSKMLEQFYTYYIDNDVAFNLQIIFDESDMKNGKVHCIFNQFQPEGEYLFELLGYEGPIIPYHKYLDNHFNIQKEQMKDGVDYYGEYLKLTLELLYMIEKHYQFYMEKENSGGLKKVCFDNSEELRVYSNQGEVAGKYAWNVLEFDKDIITRKELFELEESIKEKLLSRLSEKQLVKKMF